MQVSEILNPGQLSLPELAQQINTRVQAAEDQARNAMQNALEAGVLLNDAKALVPHGTWNDWLTQNCTAAPRTARAYMRLATKYRELPESKRQRVADLPIREAFKAIATEPTSPRTSGETAVRPPRDQQERQRVVKTFKETAKGINEASKLFSFHMDLKPAKVAALRKKLTDVIAELDRLQAQQTEETP